MRGSGGPVENGGYAVEKGGQFLAESGLHVSVDVDQPVNELLAASPGRGAFVIRIVLVASAPTIIQFASGVDLLTGPIELAAQGSFVLDEHFLTVARGEPFLLVQTGASRLGGMFVYQRTR